MGQPATMNTNENVKKLQQLAHAYSEMNTAASVTQFLMQKIGHSDDTSFLASQSDST
jgi:hypothetical protein